MDRSDKARFGRQYQKLLRALKLQGMSDNTIDAYARAVRRLATHLDRCPDRVSKGEMAGYFSALIDSHSWSTVKVDRNGLQFYWRHVLNKEWQWVELVKPPKVHTLPDILSVAEVDQLIAAARRLRYRVFVLTTYSMALRLSETLSLQVSDIDAANERVHIRRGKGHKDRFVPLPQLTYQALRVLWSKHRHPTWLFPAGTALETIAQATASMPRAGAQAAVKALVQECGIKKKSPSTPCAIRSPRICSMTASVYGRSKPCSATPAPPPPPAIPI